MEQQNCLMSAKSQREFQERLNGASQGVVSDPGEATVVVDVIEIDVRGHNLVPQHQATQTEFHTPCRSEQMSQSTLQAAATDAGQAIAKDQLERAAFGGIILPRPSTVEVDHVGRRRR